MHSFLSPPSCLEQANVSMLERDAAIVESNLQQLSAVSRAAAQHPLGELARLQTQAAAHQVWSHSSLWKWHCLQGRHAAHARY